LLWRSILHSGLEHTDDGYAAHVEARDIQESVDHTVALFQKHGFEVVGYWVPLDAPRSANTFIYILAFPDRETAKAKWDAFHNDPEWLKARDEFQSKYGKTVDKVESLFVSPTDFSPLK
jgi:hypothetical protein